MTTPLPPDGPLARALERGRDRYNGRFAYARRLNRRLDPEAFSDFLVRTIEPLARVVSEAAPDRVEPVVEALFDTALELFGRDALGPAARRPEVALIWEQVLPAAAPLLAADPGRLAASLSNAAYNLAEQLGDRTGAWIERLQRIAPFSRTVEEFLAAGQVLAWRSGLAQYRAGALAVWSGLPENLAYAVLGLDKTPRPSIQDLRQALNDPWRRPETAGRTDLSPKLALVQDAGGFRGFGGQFVSPPEITAAGGLLYAFDAESCWSLHADCFGATLQRYGPDLPPGAGEKHPRNGIQGGKVRFDGLTAALPEHLLAFSSFAAIDSVLALTLPRSHKVFLVARTWG